MRSGAAVLAAALAVGLVYIALLAWAVPLNGLWSGDQGAKLVQVVSLIRHRFTSGAIVEMGAAADPAGRFSALPALYTWRQGSAYYSIFSYPYAALTAPWFFLLGYAGLYVVPVAATLSALALAATLGARLGLRAAWSLVPILGLATPVGFYALVFWEHALATALAMGALFYATLACSPSGRASRYAWIAGALAGLAWWFRAECLWLGPALLAGMVWAKAGRQSVAWATGGLLVGLLPMAALNLLVFGLPLGPQVAVNFATPGAGTPGALLAARGAIAATMLLDGPGRGLGWLNAIVALALAATWAGRGRRWLIAGAASLALVYLAWPGAKLLHTGLVAACPLALLTLSACRRTPMSRPAVRLLIGAAAVFICGVLLTAPNDGGSQWGPRYLLPALPALVIVGLVALDHPEASQRLPRTLALSLLIAAGLLAGYQGVRVLRASTATSLRLIQVVNAQAAQPVLTDVWYAPQLLAPLYFERTILLLPTPDDLPAFNAAMREQGVARFSYLTVRPWGRDARLPAGSGAICARVEGLGYGLTLLDCRLDASSVTGQIWTRPRVTVARSAY